MYVKYDNDLTRNITLGIIAILLIITSICGNMLVCVAVFTVRQLKRVPCNYFIVSLAVADLLVVCYVMPFAIARDVQQRWMFGHVFCRIWISSDVICRTATVLNLCVISVDRYANVQYAMHYQLTIRKAVAIIASVWIFAVLSASIPIHLLLKPLTDREVNGRAINIDHNVVCLEEFSLLYTLMISAVSFYIPGLITLAVYFKLYLFARRHVISIQRVRTTITPSCDQTTNGSGSRIRRRLTRAWNNKALFTLGVITGAFICCWLPYYVIFFLDAYDRELLHPDVIFVCRWLGYTNSSLNPIIYSSFNTEFREAFKKVLFCRFSRTGSIRTTYNKPGDNRETDNTFTLPIAFVLDDSLNYSKKTIPHLEKTETNEHRNSSDSQQHLTDKETTTHSMDTEKDTQSMKIDTDTQSMDTEKKPHSMDTENHTHSMDTEKHTHSLEKEIDTEKHTHSNGTEKQINSMDQKYDTWKHTDSIDTEKDEH